jgi:hypothetical protein
MGVGRPFRRIGLCHAKCDFAGLDQLPEPIELLPLLHVRAHESRREPNIPLRDALEAADGREGAAVTNRGNVFRHVRRTAQRDNKFEKGMTRRRPQTRQRKPRQVERILRAERSHMQSAEFDYSAPAELFLAKPVRSVRDGGRGATFRSGGVTHTESLRCMA